MTTHTLRASPSPQRTARQPRLSGNAESRGPCHAAGTLVSVRAARTGRDRATIAGVLSDQRGARWAAGYGSRRFGGFAQAAGTVLCESECSHSCTRAFGSTFGIGLHEWETYKRASAPSSASRSLPIVEDCTCAPAKCSRTHVSVPVRPRTPRPHTQKGRARTPSVPTRPSVSRSDARARLAWRAPRPRALATACRSTRAYSSMPAITLTALMPCTWALPQRRPGIRHG